jgi:serine/threonine-protein kinase
MVGRIFMGRYETIRLLGEGGMGRVYLARQLDLGRQVVVKVMHDHIASDPKFCERFQRETLLMARFQHPFAVTLYDASLNDPQGPCIVMEYIRGLTLDALLQHNSRLSPARTGRLLGQLCEVLQAAHNEGIIHRDLKPANLMVVDPDTPYELIKVMDFGLAKLLDKSTLVNVTNPGTEYAIGTPGYMCPEQARGEEMDHRGDLYSVGVILFEMLTGRLPFSGGSTMDVLLAHATEEPPLFNTLGMGDLIPAAVEEAVRRCMAKFPEQRPANARELAEDYEMALAQEYMPANEFPVPMNGDGPQQSGSTVRNTPVEVYDPNSMVHHLEAWMPERIASYKLRGFVNDTGGELLECVPGRIRVRLGGHGSVYAATNSSLSWLGIGRKSGLIDLELLLHRSDPSRESQLRITVTMRPTNQKNIDADWRSRCSQIYCDLRAYLMGHSGTF